MKSTRQTLLRWIVSVAAMVALLPVRLAAQSRFPIPEFSDRPAARQAAERLRSAHDRLRGYFCEQPAKDAPREVWARWSSGQDRRIVEFLLAEEHLVWEAASGYTKQESDALAPIYGNFRNINETLRRVRQRDQSVDRYLGYADWADSVQRSLVGAERGGMAGILILQLYYRQLQEFVARLDAQSAVDLQGISQMIRANQRILAEVFHSVRRRGLAEVNRRVRPAEFRLHRPAIKRQRELLDQRLLAGMLQRVNAPKNLLYPGVGSYEVLESERDFYTALDRNEMRRIVSETAFCGEITGLPVISLEKRTYARGETMSAQFRTPGQYNGKVWVAIVPPTEPRQKTASNVGDPWREASNFSRLGALPDGAGRLDLIVPNKPGLYEIRFYDERNGRVVLANEITVR